MVILGDKHDFVADQLAGEKIVHLINQYEKIEERALEIPAHYTTNSEKMKGIFSE